MKPNEVLDREFTIGLKFTPANYQPLSGKLADALLWFDRHWGPVYDVQHEAAYKLGDDPLF